MLQTEQSLHNDADQIENGGHSNTTMLALVPSARSVTDTFPANQGESIHCMAFVICISFLNLPFLANFYKLTGMSQTTTTTFDKLANLQLIISLFLATYFLPIL